MLSIFKKSFLTIVLGLFVFFFFSNLEAKESKSPEDTAWHVCVADTMEKFSQKIQQTPNLFLKNFCSFLEATNIRDCKKEMYRYNKIDILEYKMDEYILKVEIEPFCGKHP